MLDLVWEDSSKQSGNITFTDLVNMVLNMRGSNPATVKARDCKQMQHQPRTVPPRHVADVPKPCGLALLFHPVSFQTCLHQVVGATCTYQDCKEQIRVTNSLMRRCFVELSDELDVTWPEDCQFPPSRIYACASSKERFSQVRTEIQNSMDEYPDDEDITESQALQFRSYEVEVADIGRRSDAAAAAEET